MTCTTVQDGSLTNRLTTTNEIATLIVQATEGPLRGDKSTEVESD